MGASEWRMVKEDEAMWLGVSLNYGRGPVGMRGPGLGDNG